MFVAPGQWPASEVPPLLEHADVVIHSPLRPLLIVHVCASTEGRAAAKTIVLKYLKCIVLKA
jgi:hypothetical protein